MPVGALAFLSARNLLRNLLALVLGKFRGSRFKRGPRFVLGALATCFATCSLWR
ncbi:MAG: hypothetical protein RL591_1915, partial [Planctomycetota bacterium]